MMELTDRETEIVDLLRQGMSYPQIGLELEISPRTAKEHGFRISLKLGCAPDRCRIVEAIDGIPKIDEAKLEKLTDKEKAIARLMFRGLKNKEIQQELGYSSEQVVKNTNRQIFDKLGASTRYELQYFLKAS